MAKRPMLQSPRYCSMISALAAAFIVAVSSTISCFSFHSTSSVSFSSSRRHVPRNVHLPTFIVENGSVTPSSLDTNNHRRQILGTAMAVILSTCIQPVASAVELENSTRLYVDPQGLFSLLIPKRFFVIRRETNGDDSSSSSSSKNSIVLTAGDLAKAQLVSIERLAISQLLQQQAGISLESIQSTTTTTTLSNLGTAQAIVQLLVLRRAESQQQQQQQGLSTRIIPNSIHTSSDDQSITFQLATNIPVQKPELLMEQYGVDQLIRLTLGKVSIARGDGTLMVIYASGLQQDLKKKDDGSWTEQGQALVESVDSFIPTVSSTKNIKR